MSNRLETVLSDLQDELAWQKRLLKRLVYLLLVTYAVVVAVSFVVEWGVVV